MNMTNDNDIKIRILETAKFLFLQNGYSAASMDALARKLGMSKKTIYKYFKSKYHLLEEIIDYQANL